MNSLFVKSLSSGNVQPGMALNLFPASVHIYMEHVELGAICEITVQKGLQMCTSLSCLVLHH